jgi:hypothetical protein
MNRKIKGMLQVFIAAALLVVMNWFIVSERAVANLGYFGSLAIALLFAIIAIVLVVKAVINFIKEEKEII